MKLFRKKLKKKRVGLALGGGGARGLAHIHVLETLDELGIRPQAISGTSVGSVMGALYASGLSGTEIRDLVDGLLHRKVEKVTDVFTRRDLLKWIDVIDPVFHRGALLKGEKFMRFLSESMACKTFEELEIPLHISTTDYGTGSEVIFRSGELLSAVQASMAIPGIFFPVEKDGRMLVDGGLVNPLPYNLLKSSCDLIIAVDVSGSLKETEKRPDFFDAIFGSFHIVQSTLIAEQVRNNPPDIYLKPDLKGVRMLEFHRRDQIFKESEPVKQELRQLLSSHGVI
jgi:NTE family protein